MNWCRQLQGGTVKLPLQSNYWADVLSECCVTVFLLALLNSFRTKFHLSQEHFCCLLIRDTNAKTGSCDLVLILIKEWMSYAVVFAFIFSPSTKVQNSSLNLGQKKMSIRVKLDVSVCCEISLWMRFIQLVCKSKQRPRGHSQLGEWWLWADRDQCVHNS